MGVGEGGGVGRVGEGEIGNRKSEIGSRKAEGGSRKSEVGSRKGKSEEGRGSRKSEGGRGKALSVKKANFGVMGSKIKIVPYDPGWAEAFEREYRQLEARLAPVLVSVEHIGSTAVEGLGSKPIIDILIGIDGQEALNSVAAPLLDMGYCYYPCYEVKIPERRFFARLPALQRQVFEDVGQIPAHDAFPHTHHLHVVAYGSPFWKRHLAFRDYLRTHSMARDAYHRMKVKLANGTWESSDDYAEAKTGFIRSIERLMELGR